MIDSALQDHLVQVIMAQKDCPGSQEMVKILSVVGARPNSMKIDPVLRALERDADRFSSELLHTGQHYDDNMSRVFFHDLELRPPNIDLGILEAAFSILGGQVPQGRIPELWDGHAAERIVAVLAQIPFKGRERLPHANQKSDLRG